MASDLETGIRAAATEPDSPGRGRRLRIPKFLRNGLVLGVLVVVGWYIILPEVFRAKHNVSSLEAVFTEIAERITTLRSDPKLIRRGAVWAALNWLLDAACLWVFLLALHHYVSPIDVFVAYGIGNLLAAIPITPGGLGTVELAVTALLSGFGVPPLIAGLAVLGWRLLNFWIPIPVGGACYVSLRIGRGETLPQLARDAAASRRVPEGTGTPVS